MCGADGKACPPLRTRYPSEGLPRATAIGEWTGAPAWSAMPAAPATYIDTMLLILRVDPGAALWILRPDRAIELDLA